MAITAANFTKLQRRPNSAGAYEITGLFTLPASYVAAGEPLTNALVAAKLGIKAVELLNFQPAVDVTNNLAAAVVFDRVKTATTQGKIRVFASGGAAANGATEVAGGQNMSTYATSFYCVGV